MRHAKRKTNERRKKARVNLDMYNHLDPVEALVAAWVFPGEHPVYHRNMQDRVARSMPLVARAIERIVIESSKGDGA